MCSYMGTYTQFIFEGGKFERLIVSFFINWDDRRWNHWLLLVTDPLNVQRTPAKCYEKHVYQAATILTT